MQQHPNLLYVLQITLFYRAASISQLVSPSPSEVDEVGFLTEADLDRSAPYSLLPVGSHSNTCASSFYRAAFVLQPVNSSPFAVDEVGS